MGMGEILREFGVKVSLAFDSKKIDAAEDKLKKFGDEMKSFALQVGGMAAAVFESQNLFTSNARSLQNQADMLGINTEKLQEYEYAAKVAANVNREDLVGSMESLATTMDKARAGDVEARQALENIGGAMGDQSAIIAKLNDKNYTAADAMLDMSAGIEKISKSSPVAAKRLVEMTMGSDKLYNLMRQGPKAINKLTAEGSKNFALNSKMIKQGYQMDIQMSKLWMQFRKLGYEIGYSVMKHLAPMIKQFTKWFELNKGIIASGINAFLDTFADALEFIFHAGVKIIEFLQPLIEYLGGVKSAVHLVIEAFLAFKALSLVGSLGSMALSFAKLGASASSILGPLAAVIAAGAAGAAIGTLINKGLDKMIGPEGLGGKIYDWTHPGETQAAFASAPAGGGGGGAAVAQENHFHTQNNISVPPGTTPHAAAAMISKANADSHENMMVKAKMDAARSKVY